MIFNFPDFRWTLAGTSFRWRTGRFFLAVDFFGMGSVWHGLHFGARDLDFKLHDYLEVYTDNARVREAPYGLWVESNTRQWNSNEASR